MASPPASTAPAPPPPLPSPSTFDLLPPLYSLLARLLAHQQQSSTSSSSTTNAADPNDPSTASPLPPNHTAASPLPPTPSQLNNSADPPLSPKDFVAAASDIRSRVTRAREAVRGLPDVGRSTVEQEEEILELEGEGRRLRGVIAGIRGQGEGM